MKINALTAALGALIAASTAPADFTGLFIDIKCTTCWPGPGFLAFNVYARFDSPTDRLMRVTGAALTPLGGMHFYQNPFGTATEPNPVLIAVFPDLQWDTFVTIGLKQQGPPGTPLTSLEFGSAMTGSGFTGGWMTSRNAPQGLGEQIPGQTGFHVLLAQLTIQNPSFSAGVGGSMTIVWKTMSSGAQYTDVDFTWFAIPAPGALALLGTAGVAGLTFRRRR
jgi:hypothetical protein